MDPRSYNEKRDFRRIEMVDCPISFRNLATGDTGTGTVRNLSGGGLLVACGSALPMGAHFRVTVKPERSLVPPLDAEAEVVRVIQVANGYEIGFTITSFAPVP